MSIGHLFTHTCDIYISSVVSGETGQKSRAWVVSASGIACAIQPRGESYPLEQKGFLRRGTHEGFFDIGSAPERGNRILWQSVYYDVVGVHIFRGNHAQIALAEVQDRPTTPAGGGS